jgi:hypothetical protein
LRGPSTLPRESAQCHIDDESRVGICLQCACEILQVLAGMFALPIRRVGEPYGGRGALTGRAIIPHVRPQPASLRLAVARSEYRDRRVIGMDLRCTENVTAHGIDQRREQLARGTDPSSQRGAIQFNALPRINL